MNHENLTVAVDGGGTGCRLAAFDGAGVRLATASDGPASLSLGEELAWLHIARGIAALGAELGLPATWQPARLCLGLAGALQRNRRERFLAQVPSAIRCTLVTDGLAQLFGASAGQPGVCVAIGTGSVVHWLDEAGQVGHAGGWGFPAGDEGSGAWLGSRLLNAYLWYLDEPAGRKAGSRLFTALEERIGVNVTDVQLWSTCKQSTQLATLAPLVVACADEGDAFANELLDAGAAQCQRLLGMAPESLPAYLVGGLASVYESRLSPMAEARLQVPKGTALEGLFALSLNAAWSEA